MEHVHLTSTKKKKKTEISRLRSGKCGKMRTNLVLVLVSRNFHLVPEQLTVFYFLCHCFSFLLWADGWLFMYIIFNMFSFSPNNTNRVDAKIHQPIGIRIGALWKQAWKHVKWLHGFWAKKIPNLKTVKICRFCKCKL